MLKITAVLLVAMLLAATVTVIDMGQSAYAMKAQKTPRHANASKVGNLVCGDKLCSGPSYVKKIR